MWFNVTLFQGITCSIYLKHFCILELFLNYVSPTWRVLLVEDMWIFLVRVDMNWEESLCLKIKDPPGAWCDFKLMHNVRIPTTNSIRHGLVAEPHTPHARITVAWWGEGWELSYAVKREKEKPKDSLIEIEATGTEYNKLPNSIKTCKQIIFLSLSICETLPPPFFWSATGEFSFWGFSA